MGKNRARRAKRGGQSVQNAPNFANRTLYHGDNLEFLRGMNDECIDLIATDPPFNTGHNRSSTAGFYEDDWKWLKEGEPKPDQWSWESAVHEHWLEEIRDAEESLFNAIEAVRRSHSEGMAAFICFLSVRLLEMKRVLKPTGSIYLHCDSTANSYIRMAMDAIFGQRNFSSVITWPRYATHSLAKGFDNVADTLLVYAKDTEKVVVNKVLGKPTEEQIRTKFPYVEEETGRRFQHIALEQSSNSATAGETRQIGGRTVDGTIGWRWSQEKFDEVLSINPRAIYWTKSGRPRYKKYADEYEGVPLSNIWMDLPYLASNDSERTGSPDQKPLSLYMRIIEAASNPGDWVLDPFCGCATTPIAAEILGRKWVGIDRRTDAEGHMLNRLLYTSKRAKSQQFIPFDKKAKTFDADRLKEARNLIASMSFVFTDVPPQPTTPVKNVPIFKTVAGVKTLRKNRYIYDEMKDILIKLFGATCWGCGYRPQVSPLHDAKDYLELDHIDPVRDGGSNELTNRALLCAPCNKFKSSEKTLGAVQAEAGFRTGYRRRGAPPPIELKLAREVVRDYVENDAKQAQFATSA